MKSTRNRLAAFVVTAAFAVLMLGSSGVSALGMTDEVVGGVTVQTIMIVGGVIAIVGVILWQAVTGGKKIGKILTTLGVVVVIILGIAVMAQPVATSDDGGSGATFINKSVSTTKANFTDATNTITGVMRVIIGNDTIRSPTDITVNVTVQNTAAGASYDVSVVTGTFAPASVTDPVTGLTHSTVMPNSDGKPNCNWTCTIGGTPSTTTRSLTAQMGLVPQQTGYMAVHIDLNGAAFGASNVKVNDIIDVGTLTVGAETYSIQVLIAYVTW